MALSVLASGSWQAAKALPGRARPAAGWEWGPWLAGLGALLVLCLLSRGLWFWTAGWGSAGHLAPLWLPQLLKSGGEGVK